MHIYHAMSVNEAISVLKAHRQGHHYGHECSCDERKAYEEHLPCDGHKSMGTFTTYQDNDGQTRFSEDYEDCGHEHDYPPMTLAQELEYVLDLINRERKIAYDIVHHECKWEAHDSDTYVLPCNVCGSDGNA